MTNGERDKLQDIWDFFFSKPIGLPGEKTRAEEMEEIIKAWQSFGFLFRFLLWFSGVVFAIGVIAAGITASGVWFGSS